MTKLPWSALQATDDALMARLYMPQRRRLGSLSLTWHPGLREPEWNRIRILQADAALPSQLQHALSFLHPFGGGCVTAEPSTPAAALAILKAPAFQLVFQHAWVLYDLPPDLETTHRPPGDLRIEDLTLEHEALFRDLFHLGFATQDHSPVTHAVWDVALQETLRQDTLQTSPEHGTTHLFHSVAWWQGEPAGIASYGVRGDLAGFYNLAVHPRFRTRGIGSHLTRYRRRRARELGAKSGFLQTQEDHVLQWHLRRGAQQGPVVKGWRPSFQADQSIPEDEAEALLAGVSLGSKAGTSKPRK